MNLNRFYCIFFILILVFAGVFSCNKNSLNGGKSDRIVGKWLEVQFATDDNGNGVMDASEVHNVGNNTIDYLIFNRDSTGYESVRTGDSTMTYSFAWVYLNGDTLQRNGMGHDTVIYTVTRITAANLTLMTYTTNGLVWYLYNKQ